MNPLQIMVLVGILMPLAECSTTVTIQTKLGRITGLITSINGTQVNKYLGIPYGKPPIGDKRFAKTEPYGKFGDFNATSFGAPCVQLNGNSYKGKEDCLTLNVFCPNTTGRKSVMIWIHGGGFTSGASADYDADALSALNDIIVVTLDYRLNIFGFLTTGDGKARGNWGLWDQHTALLWVRDNIDDYGGDNGRITIFGESAGGRSVVFQMFSPKNNNSIFQRVITESGSALSLTYNNRNITENMKLLSISTGCSLGSSFLTCLRNLSTSALIESTRKIKRSFFFFPAVDNDFLPYDLGYLLSNFTNFGVTEYVRTAAGNFASYDLLGGWNDQDGLLYMGLLYEINKEMGGKSLNYGISDQVLGEALSYFPFYEYGGSPYTTTFVSQTFKNMYLLDSSSWVSDGRNVADRRIEAYMNIAGDVVLKVPVLQTLQMHSSLTNKSTYAYEFTHKPSIQAPWYEGPKWLKQGADHADEIQFVFGYPFLPKIKYTADEMYLSRRMMSYWTNFAKTGDPGKPFQKFYHPKAQKYTKIMTGNDTLLDTPLSAQQRLWSAIDSAAIQTNGDKVVISETVVSGARRFVCWEWLMMTFLLATTIVIAV